MAFVPLTDEVVGRWLMDNSGDLTERQRNWLIDFAGGSLGRAAMALDYDLLEWARTLLPAVDEMARGQPRPEVGALIAERLNQFAEAWVGTRPKASKDAANKLAGQLMWSMIAGHARRRLRQAAENCAADDPVAAEAALEPHLAAIDAVQQAQALIASNVNVSLVCDDLAARLQG